MAKKNGLTVEQSSMPAKLRELADDLEEHHEERRAAPRGVAAGFDWSKWTPLIELIIHDILDQLGGATTK
jgi:hypothetical protein